MEKITQPEQYISLLVYVIRADGIVDDEEQAGLLALLAERLETPLTEQQTSELLERLVAPGKSEATDQELLDAGRGITTENLCHLVHDAYMLAASDGEIHGSEVKTMRRYLIQESPDAPSSVACRYTRAEEQPGRALEAQPPGAKMLGDAPEQAGGKPRGEPGTKTYKTGREQLAVR